MRFKKSCLSITNQRGFTLVELLMVIAILGVLASIAIKTIAEEKAKANDTQGIALMRNLLTSAETEPPDPDTDGDGIDDFVSQEYAGAQPITPFFPDLKLNPGMKLTMYYDADGTGRFDFFLAHVGGKLGYYFWIPIDTTTTNAGFGGVPADKLVPSFDTRNNYPVAMYRTWAGW